jgi:hypothetical protein
MSVLGLIVTVALLPRAQRRQPGGLHQGPARQPPSRSRQGAKINDVIPNGPEWLCPARSITCPFGMRLAISHSAAVSSSGDLNWSANSVVRMHGFTGDDARTQ